MPCGLIFDRDPIRRQQRRGSAFLRGDFLCFTALGTFDLHVADHDDTQTNNARTPLVASVARAGCLVGGGGSKSKQKELQEVEDTNTKLLEKSFPPREPRTVRCKRYARSLLAVGTVVLMSCWN